MLGVFGCQGINCSVHCGGYIRETNNLVKTKAKAVTKRKLEKYARCNGITKLYISNPKRDTSPFNTAVCSNERMGKHKNRSCKVYREGKRKILKIE